MDLSDINKDSENRLETEDDRNSAQIVGFVTHTLILIKIFDNGTAPLAFLLQHHIQSPNMISNAIAKLSNRTYLEYYRLPR